MQDAAPQEVVLTNCFPGSQNWKIQTIWDAVTHPLISTTLEVACLSCYQTNPILILIPHFTAIETWKCLYFEGNSHCCTPGSPCGLFGGECDKDNHCAGDLVCGDNNCFPNTLEMTSNPIFWGEWDCCTTADRKNPLSGFVPESQAIVTGIAKIVSPTTECHLAT